MQVANDFGTTAPEYLGAEVFFEQSPQPALCLIGRWASGATKGLLHGATLTGLQQQLSNFTSVSAGAFLIYIDGVPTAITGISCGAALNLNGVAADVQAQLPAGVTCTWNSQFTRFDITSSTTGVGSSVSYGAPSTAVGHWTFATTPAIADTITIGTTAIAYIAHGGTPVGAQIALGTDVPTTLAATLTFLNSSADAQVVQCTYVSDGVSKIYAVFKVAGVGGNTFAIAAASTHITASGADLAGGAATDVSTTPFGLTAASGASPPVPGVAAETPLVCATALANASTQWYGLSFCATAQPSISDHAAVAAFILASSRLRIYGISTQSVAVLDPTQTNDVMSSMQVLNNKRVFCMYSSTNAYSCMTLMGRAFTVNFFASNSTLTLAWKQAPGITAETLNQTQFSTLIGKGGNVVIAVDNGAQMIWPGQMENGYWFDEVQNVDWQTNDVQTNVFNLLYQTTTKVPQTDPGDALIATVIENSLAAGVYNGMTAPGSWQAAGFGSLNTGDFLPLGYYVWYPPIATQSQANREARISVPFQCAVKLAGAVHTVDAILNVNR